MLIAIAVRCITRTISCACRQGHGQVGAVPDIEWWAILHLRSKTLPLISCFIPVAIAVTGHSSNQNAYLCYSSLFGYWTNHCRYRLPAHELDSASRSEACEYPGDGRRRWSGEGKVVEFTNVYLMSYNLFSHESWSQKDSCSTRMSLLAQVNNSWSLKSEDRGHGLRSHLQQPAQAAVRAGSGAFVFVVVVVNWLLKIN